MDLPGTIIGFAIYLAIFTVLTAIAFRQKFKFIYALMLISFAVRGAFILVDYAYEIIQLTQDAYKYDSFATQIALYLSGRSGFPKIAFDCEPGYTVPVGVIYWIFGPHPEIPALLNALFTVLTTWNIYRLSLVFFNNERGAKASAVLYSLSPYITIMSIYIWRDALINCLISQLIYMLTIRSKSNRTIFTIPIICLTFYIGFLRPENLVLLAAIIFCVFIVDTLTERRSLMWPIKISLVILFVVLIIVLIYTTLTDQRLFKQFSDLTDIASLGARQERVSEMGGAYLKWIEFNSWFSVLLFVPLKVIYFLLVPFPWDMSKMSYIVFSADAQLLLVTYLLSIKGIAYIIKKRIRFGMILLLYLFFGVAGSAIISSNVPGAQRHRTQFSFVFYILASYSLGRFFSSAQQPLDISNRRLVKRKA